ncbi:MAG TPA: hypothetical protein VK530_17255 [Candidatus Acidoferrum sp.]|nr:hypothetical protein [Candidatus Acidoferrum sp.]
MKQISLTILACASFVLSSVAATNYADAVVSYDPGVDFAVGFTYSNTVLGEPSRVAPFGEAIDPFNPPYGTNQILSVGAGGSVTIKFARRIYHAPRKPFGLDFIIFGNCGFIVTNEFDLETFSYIGTPATDGSMFAHNTGITRVSVSRDGKKFFTLEPESAPVVDALFPTDSVGNFDLPVNPTLTLEDFAGATLADMRALYDGSAGGAGFNFRDARNENGRRVRLPWIRYVRVEVIEGKAEIDAFSAVARHWPRRAK